MALFELATKLLGILLATVGIDRLLHGDLGAAAALMVAGLVLSQLTAAMEKVLRRPGGPWEGNADR